jgi:hypothetical protein
VRAEPRGTPLILGDVVHVLTAIDLNDEPPLLATEVGDVRTDLVLAPDLVSAESPVAEMRPQPAFGIRHLAPQSTRRLACDRSAFIAHFYLPLTLSLSRWERGPSDSTTRTWAIVFAPFPLGEGWGEGPK